MVKYFRSVLNSVSAHLPGYLWKGPLKLDFLDIYLTLFFAVRKLKNTSALRVVFFLKIFKIKFKLRNYKKKIETIFFASEIIASDIYLTTFFAFRKFKNTSGVRVIFFLKMCKIESKLRKLKKKKFTKYFLFLR